MEHWSTDESIAALASAPGPGLRHIIRISGPQIVSQLQHFGFTTADGSPVDLSAIRSPTSLSALLEVNAEAPLPITINLWPTNRSYTGQPMAELLLIGSPPLSNLLLKRLTDHGIRLANRGEFTLRAFLAGRIDLLQAEAVLGMIDAPDNEVFIRAMKQLSGDVSSQFTEFHERLVETLADLEAGLDFIEEDIDFVDRTEFEVRLQQDIETLTHLLQLTDSRSNQQLKYRIALVGLPNAGKSSLFNQLTGSKALVSNQAGTTTDYLTASVSRENLTFEFIDTAGWEQQTDGIAGLAQQLREASSREADCLLWCHAADVQAEESSIPQLAASESFYPEDQLLERIDILTKADLQTGCSLPTTDLQLSVQTGQGIEQLWQQLTEKAVGDRVGSQAELLGSTAARCRDCLNRAHQALQSTLALLQAGGGDELMSFELRIAIDALGEIVGVTYSDDLLGRIFSKFCIGK